MLPRDARSRVMLIDSCTPAAAFEATLQIAQPCVDLIIFDTTCFAGGSKRIGRVLRRARNAMIPVVTVRSHNKLDSLGVEYGRLGSVVFIESPAQRDGAKPQLLQRLLAETAQRRSLVWQHGAAGAFSALRGRDGLPPADR